MTPASAPLGQRLMHLDRVSSTQEVLARFVADRTQHGLVVRADEQTAGRGRRGTPWLSAPGGSLMFSVLLFPPPPLRRPAALTVLAGVSVCEVVAASTGRLPRLKWPNDVLLDGKKICGILVEVQREAALVGVGLNVSVPEGFFKLAGLEEAGSLLTVTGRAHDPNHLFGRLLAELDRGYSALVAGQVKMLEERWARYCELMNSPVAIRTGMGDRVGILRRVAFDRVDFEDASGEAWSFAPEVIQRLERCASEG